MEEKEHMDRFNHVYPSLKVRPADLKRVKEQPFEYFMVLDLEGRVEILEFPVLLVDAKTLDVVDRFHRYLPFPFSSSLCWYEKLPPGTFNLHMAFC